MRHKRNAQTSLFDPQAVDHPVADELERASEWLDAHPELLDEVAADLGAGSGTGRGRCGLSCDTVLRCAVLKHLRQETYRSLEFALRDSLSAQRFARVDAARLPGKSALQATIGSIRAETWERINRHLLGAARDERVETGDQVRVDSTATETHILEPSDSRLLYDGVRVLTRPLTAARDKLGADAVSFHDHRRAAKRRALEIGSQRGAAKRAQTYRKLLRLLARTVDYVEAALPAVSAAGTPWALAWEAAATEYGDLLARVVDQTSRRVFQGETVPAAEKVVSLFEPHTDIIRKGGRDTYYGHKVNFATGRSGLVLDAVVEDGNPADSARCLPMLERHVEHYGAAPSRAAFDGGYASRGNLDAAKGLGVAHVVFHKKRGMRVADMTPSSWLYARHRGVEQVRLDGACGPWSRTSTASPTSRSCAALFGVGCVALLSRRVRYDRHQHRRHHPLRPRRPIHPDLALARRGSRSIASAGGVWLGRRRTPHRLDAEEVPGAVENPGI